MPVAEVFGALANPVRKRILADWLHGTVLSLEHRGFDLEVKCEA